jgi:hypothetical protein
MTLWNVWKKDDTFLAIQKRQKKQQQFVSHNKMKSYCTFPQNGNAHFTLGIFVKTHGFLYKMVGHILKLVFFKTYQNSSLSFYSHKFTFFFFIFSKTGWESTACHSLQTLANVGNNLR